MRFCGNCGSGLAAAGPEERKVVTVLFADAVASTRLAGQLDPERLRGQMAQFFQLAREEIDRFGGTVEKFIGDAVMAVFGLPAVHEDDPERAARAALAIRRGVAPLADAGALPAVRIGLLTGEVVANPRASEKGEFLVTGEVANLAARLQQYAAPGQILLGERTMRSLPPSATLRRLDSLTVKGRADPLPAWELMDLAPQAERPLGATPFVGREEELDLLAGLLRRMRREGRGHVVTILGPAGVGKTRLIREFRTRSSEVHILSGRSIPYGSGVPFWALGEAIREECGIVLEDATDEVQRKIERTARALSVEEAIPALQSILGLAGGDLSRDELFARLQRFFEGLAQRRPLLLILEDVHSAEDVTLDFAEASAEWVRQNPLLLLMLTRPDLLERRPAWMGGKRSATTILLEPLPGEESQALARAVLGTKEAPVSVLDAVLSRAEGNPLFLEEMLRTLIERGDLVAEADRWVLAAALPSLVIPDTVHAVIAARVDGLPPAEKSALQDAALQGKDFWLGALRHVAEENHIDETIRALVAKDLLVPKRRSLVAGDEELTFRHILIRDVAFAMIPKSRRWPKHARLAEWLARISTGRPAEWADIIAHHWLQVIGLRQELGLPPDPQARDQAVSHLMLAGDRAAAVYANTTALDHYTRVLDLEADPTRRARAFLGRAEVWMLLGQYDRARADLEPARRLAGEQGEARLEATTLSRIGYSFHRQDKVVPALEHLQQALEISRHAGDAVLTGRILNHIGFSNFNDGRSAEAIRHHEEARQLLESAGDTAGLAESLHGLGENRMFQGRWTEGVHWMTEAIRLCEQTGNRSLAEESRLMIAHSQHVLGDYPAAEASAQYSVTVLAQIGDIRNQAMALLHAAQAAIKRGKLGSAVEQATRGAALGRQIGAIRATVYNLVTLGSAYRELEDDHDARQADEEAVHLASQVGGAWMPWVLAGLALDYASLSRIDEAMARLREARDFLEAVQTRLDFPQLVTYAEGRVHLAAGEPEKAREAAERLRDLAASTGTSYWTALALLILGEAAAASGDHDAAARAFLESAGDADRRGGLPTLWRALAGLAQSQRLLYQHAEAEATARRAREIIEQVGASVADERLRAIYFQSSRVQRVLTDARA